MTAALIDLPPRGLALLHANLPRARKQVEALSDIVIRAGLRNPALNILCSGDFGWDPDYLKSLVHKYSQADRRPHVLFYLTNGPAARHWKSQVLQGFASRLPPEEFRQKIQKDRQFQCDFQRLAQRLAEIITEIFQAGGQVSVVPQLEDNQTDKSFAILLEISRAALPQDLPIRFGRNPCVSCYPGNQGGLPAGCFLEEHHHSANTDFTLRDGVLSNDGCTYSFPGETPLYLPRLPLADFANVQSRSGLMNSTFILWNAKYQGLTDRGTDPEGRDYAMPTEVEREIIVKFLQKP